MLECLEVFSWLCEISADSSSCFFTLLSSDCISSRFLDGRKPTQTFLQTAQLKLLNFDWTFQMYFHLRKSPSFMPFKPSGTSDWGKVWRKLSSTFDHHICYGQLWGLPQFWNERLADHSDDYAHEKCIGF